MLIIIIFGSKTLFGAFILMRSIPNLYLLKPVAFQTFLVVVKAITSPDPTMRVSCFMS